MSEKEDMADDIRRRLEADGARVQTIEIDDMVAFNIMGIGLLGATFDSRMGVVGAQAARDEMIERRILRLEMLLRRAGIEPEMIPLREIR